MISGRRKVSPTPVEGNQLFLLHQMKFQKTTHRRILKIPFKWSIPASGRDLRAAPWAIIVNTARFFLSTPQGPFFSMEVSMKISDRGSGGDDSAGSGTACVAGVDLNLASEVQQHLLPKSSPV